MALKMLVLGQMRLIGLYDTLNMSCQQEWVVIQEFKVEVHVSSTFVSIPSAYSNKVMTVGLGKSSFLLGWNVKSLLGYFFHEF